MRIIGYGEDAFTLSALMNRLPELLRELSDHSNPGDCLAFYRPSFGRGGGEGSSQFGEFDFILITSQAIYLGESKWQYSPEIKSNKPIDKRQINRHERFKSYLELWLSKENWTWQDFMSAYTLKYPTIQIPPLDSLLKKNLQYVLTEISKRKYSKLRIADVLLVFNLGKIENEKFEALKKVYEDKFRLIVEMKESNEFISLQE